MFVAIACSRQAQTSGRPVASVKTRGYVRSNNSAAPRKLRSSLPPWSAILYPLHRSRSATGHRRGQRTPMTCNANTAGNWHGHRDRGESPSLNRSSSRVVAKSRAEQPNRRRQTYEGLASSRLTPTRRSIPAVRTPACAPSRILESKVSW